MAAPRHRTTIENLPSEVLLEIFIRLLAKQLAQMRSVCKPWNALLSESSFIKSHLHHSICNNNEVLLFLRQGFSFDYGSLTARASCSPDFELTNFIKLPINPQPDTTCGSIIGSVNGLVCLCYKSFPYYRLYPDYVVHIWNPSLSAVLTLPPLSLPSHDHAHFGFGFGFDPKSEDYKVVVITKLSPPPNLLVQVQVYSMRKGFWKSIYPRLPSHIRSIWSQNQVCLDGHIHWFGCIDEKEKLETILSFDLDAESFSEITLPDTIINYNLYEFCIVLGVLGGKLCVVLYVLYSGCEVWVMDEYGVAESWGKHHDVIPQVRGGILPHGVISRNEFLFKWFNRDDFSLYNQDAGKSKIFKITKEYPYVSQVIEYVDSLVWITPTKQ